MKDVLDSPEKYLGGWTYILPCCRYLVQPLLKIAQGSSTVNQRSFFCFVSIDASCTLPQLQNRCIDWKTVIYIAIISNMFDIVMSPRVICKTSLMIVMTDMHHDSSKTLKTSFWLLTSFVVRPTSVCHGTKSACQPWSSVSKSALSLLGNQTCQWHSRCSSFKRWWQTPGVKSLIGSLLGFEMEENVVDRIWIKGLQVILPPLWIVRKLMFCGLFLICLDVHISRSCTEKQIGLWSHVVMFTKKWLVNDNIQLQYLVVCLSVHECLHWMNGISLSESESHNTFSFDWQWNVGQERQWEAMIYWCASD